MASNSVQQLSLQETRDLIKNYQENDDSHALDILVEEYLPLVKYLARRFVRDGVSYDDLVQVGSIALLKAIKRYKHDSGVKLTTFATPTIIGEIKHFFRDKQWSIKVPRRIKETGNKIYNITPKLAQKLGRMPTPKEIAEYLKVSEEVVLEALEWGQSYQTASLDNVVISSEDSKDVTLLNALGKEDQDLKKVDDCSELEDILKILSDKERKILYLRFEEELSQMQIGKIMGMSQMQVSRVLRKITGKLQERRKILSV